jgi:hypothetical protein
MHTRCQNLSRCMSIVIGEGAEGPTLGGTDTRLREPGLSCLALYFVSAIAQHALSHSASSSNQGDRSQTCRHWSYHLCRRVHRHCTSS